MRAVVHCVVRSYLSPRGRTLEAPQSTTASERVRPRGPKVRPRGPEYDRASPTICVDVDGDTVPRHDGTFLTTHPANPSMILVRAPPIAPTGDKELRRPVEQSGLSPRPGPPTREGPSASARAQTDAAAEIRPREKDHGDGEDHGRRRLDHDLSTLSMR